MTTQAEWIHSRLADDPDLNELVEMFVGDLPDRVNSLRAAWTGRDWETLRTAAHQMKGAAGSYGFDPLSPAAATVERGVKEGWPEAQIQEALDGLLELCSRVRAGTP